MFLKLWLPSAIALVSESMADTLWRSVNVDTNNLGSELSNVISEVPIRHQCGTLCDRNPNCLSWSYENISCTLSDLMVSPLHKATTDNTVKFYTGMEKDLSLGSTVTAYAQHYLNASVTLLLNGIYNKNRLESCYLSYKWKRNPWVLFELESTQKIRRISVTVKIGGSSKANPHGVEIRVGSVSPSTDGDFAYYKLFGKLPSTAEAGKTYTLESTDGIIGRFVSIQKINPGTTLPLDLCYVFIG